MQKYAQIYAKVTTKINGDTYTFTGKVSKNKLIGKKGLILHLEDTDTICLYCNYRPKREKTTYVSDFLQVVNLVNSLSRINKKQSI